MSGNQEWMVCCDKNSKFSLDQLTKGFQSRVFNMGVSLTLESNDVYNYNYVLVPDKNLGEDLVVEMQQLGFGAICTKKL